MPAILHVVANIQVREAFGANVHFWTFLGTNGWACTFTLGRRRCSAWWRRGGTRVFNRQAATLLKFAKVVADPGLAAGLVEKAADLKD
jgi:hypothetical protein